MVRDKDEKDRLDYKGFGMLCKGGIVFIVLVVVWRRSLLLDL